MSSGTKLAQGKSPEVLNQAIRNAGYHSQRDFAQHIGKSQSAVSQVISGDFKSAYIAGKIAALIGRSPAEVWPHLYQGA